MVEEVEPPCGLGGAPAVHGHRDDVRAVLEVSHDRLALLAGLAADGHEAHRPPLAWPRPPEAASATGPALIEAMGDRGGPDEPAGWQERGAVVRVRPRRGRESVVRGQRH